MQTWRLLLPLCLFCLPAINCQLRVERNKISSVFWEYHAWSRNTGRKLSSNDYQRELPVSENEASELMCSTLSQLPSDADLVAISGTSFHPALNRFCQLARIACVYTDSQVGRHMPTDWQYNAINFFPAPELRSRSIYEFVKWSEWTEFAVLYTGFHDLERMHTLLPFPNGHVMFRMINLDFPSLTFRLLTQLKLTTMHRFLLALPQTLVPKFLNLASAANLTSMAYNFLLVGGMNRTYFREHVASRLYSGVNFTSHQFDGVSFIDDPVSQKIELTRTEAINRLLRDAYVEWNRSLGQTRLTLTVRNSSSTSDDIRVLNNCHIRLGDNTSEFYLRLDSNIKRRVGVVTVGGSSVYNFSFCVNHMYTDTAPKTPEISDGVVKFATWTADQGFKLTPGAQYKHRKYYEDLLNDMNLTVVTVVDPPFSFQRDFDEDGNRLTGNDRWTGFSIELFKQVAKKINCRYTIRLSRDGQFGSPSVDKAGNTVWSGTVGELIAGTADVAVASLVITYDREMVIDFTTPYMSLGLSLIMKKTEQEQDLFQFLLPFSTRVWAYMMLAWLLASLVMYFCARISPYEWYSQSACVPVVENQFNAFNSLWFTIGSLMQQGSDLAPRASSTRMVGTVWWFFTLILISSYTANLAAFLTVTRLNAVDSLDALAAQSKIKYGCATGGAMFNFFKNSKIPVYRRMWESMVLWNATNESFVKKTIEGIAKVRKGGYAYVIESTFNQYYRERDCNLTQIGGIFNPSSYAFAVQQGANLLKDKLSEAILQLHKEQLIEGLTDRWLKRFNISGKPCSETVSDQSNMGTLDVDSVGGVFVTLLLGLALALILCIAELIYRSCVLASRNKQTSFKQLCAAQIRLAINLCTNKKPEPAEQAEPLNNRVRVDNSSYTLDLAEKRAPLCIEADGL